MVLEEQVFTAHGMAKSTVRLKKPPKTPSHAGTAGEFTLHVAGSQARQADFGAFSHRVDWWTAAGTSTCTYVYVSFGRQLTPT